jgi:hypothetical protein
MTVRPPSTRPCAPETHAPIPLSPAPGDSPPEIWPQPAPYGRNLPKFRGLPRSVFDLPEGPCRSKTERRHPGFWRRSPRHHEPSAASPEISAAPVAHHRKLPRFRRVTRSVFDVPDGSWPSKTERTRPPHLAGQGHGRRPSAAVPLTRQAGRRTAELTLEIASRPLGRGATCALRQPRTPCKGPQSEARTQPPSTPARIRGTNLGRVPAPGRGSSGSASVEGLAA